MKLNIPAVLACLVLVSGCAAEGFTDQELTLSTRQVEVTVENRSPSVVLVMFTSDTMGGLELVRPGVTESFRFDAPPFPGPPPRPPFREEPESWSLDLGRPVLGVQDQVLGIQQPVWDVARGQEPFFDAVEHLFVRIDATGATWRRLIQ